MSKKLSASVSHHAREIEELRANQKLAVEYLKVAMVSRHPTVAADMWG